MAAMSNCDKYGPTERKDCSTPDATLRPEAIRKHVLIGENHDGIVLAAVLLKVAGRSLEQPSEISRIAGVVEFREVRPDKWSKGAAIAHNDNGGLTAGKSEPTLRTGGNMRLRLMAATVETMRERNENRMVPAKDTIGNTANTMWLGSERTSPLCMASTANTNALSRNPVRAVMMTVRSARRPTIAAEIATPPPTSGTNKCSAPASDMGAGSFQRCTATSASDALPEPKIKRTRDYGVDDEDKHHRDNGECHAQQTRTARSSSAIPTALPRHSGDAIKKAATP